MRTTFALLLVAFLLVGCTRTVADASTVDAGTNTMPNPHAILHTSKGDIELELYADKAPITVKNFVDLASSGFYDGTAFHRVISDFMIQGGDPLSKDYSDPRIGTGGPPYRIKDEFGPGLNFAQPGVLAMANAGPNTGGSQFFITVAPTPWLNGKHAIFGRIVNGGSVVDAIEAAPRGPNDKPLTAITINSIEIQN